MIKIYIEDIIFCLSEQNGMLVIENPDLKIRIEMQITNIDSVDANINKTLFIQKIILSIMDLMRYKTAVYDFAAAQNNLQQANNTLSDLMNNFFPKQIKIPKWSLN